MNAIPPKPTNEKPIADLKVSEPRVQTLATRLGRGRLGGSTICDLIVQRGRRAGRPVMVADGDRRNATLAGIYPPGSPGGASVPATDELADMKDWITQEVSQMVSSRASMVLDLGGGDWVLADYGEDLPLASFCEAAGVTCLPLYPRHPRLQELRQSEHVALCLAPGVPPALAAVIDDHQPAGTASIFPAMPGALGRIELPGPVFQQGGATDSCLQVLDFLVVSAHRPAFPVPGCDTATACWAWDKGGGAAPGSGATHPCGASGTRGSSFIISAP